MSNPPNSITIEMKDSNEIHFPFEWCVGEKLGHGFVQITLVDDRIVIHKPLAADVKYTKPCKAGDNSYIRTLDFLGIRVPKQFFEKLAIESGDKIDVMLEDNCISIRKNLGIPPEVSVPEPPEPIMAFCCVCGDLLYTEGSLVKVESKYICHGCIDIVKAL